MTATWTTHISESKWRRVRRELEDNGLILPFTQGVARNKKTGYMVTNKFDQDTGRLTIKVTYPEALNPSHVGSLLDSLIGSRGTLTDWISE